MAIANLHRMTEAQREALGFGKPKEEEEEVKEKKK